MHKLKPIPVSIFVTSALFVAYLLYPCFRAFLSEQNIDPNFVLGFIAVITVLIGMWQSSKDRRLTYNMSLLNTLRDNALAIVSKLVAIRTKSEIFLATIKSIKTSMEENVIFVDGNNTTSQQDINDGFQLITAYADTYFQEECKGWNEMLGKLSDMGTDALMVIRNYENNLELIRTGATFPNYVLDNLDEIITRSEANEKEIDEVTTTIRNKLVTKINEMSSQIQKML